MLQRLLSLFTSSGEAADRLTRGEVELISAIRLSPSIPLQGPDLVKAKGLVSRGMLKSAGGNRFLVTEKAVAACRQPRK